MENAVSALKMAAAILIFIIAIGVSFSIFGTAKQTADSIIKMRDKQAYLEEAELDNGILYTSAESITTNNITGVNTNGDRVVKKDDVISTIYRYNKEKYGVTIIKNGKAIARFDSATESFISQWYNITTTQQVDYTDKIKENIATTYAGLTASDDLSLEQLYEIIVDGNTNIKCGAPWYGNNEEIQKRISCELTGKKYVYNNQEYQKDALDTILSEANKIIEVTNEIDQSKYLKDGDENNTNLLQQYEMPTVEIIYIIEN